MFLNLLNFINFCTAQKEKGSKRSVVGETVQVEGQGFKLCTVYDSLNYV